MQRRRRTCVPPPAPPRRLLRARGRLQRPCHHGASTAGRRGARHGTCEELPPFLPATPPHPLGLIRGAEAGGCFAGPEKEQQGQKRLQPGLTRSLKLRGSSAAASGSSTASVSADCPSSSPAAILTRPGRRRRRALWELQSRLGGNGICSSIGGESQLSGRGGARGATRRVSSPVLSAAQGGSALGEDPRRQGTAKVAVLPPGTGGLVSLGSEGVSCIRSAVERSSLGSGRKGRGSGR